MSQLNQAPARTTGASPRKPYPTYPPKNGNARDEENAQSKTEQAEPQPEEATAERTAKTTVLPDDGAVPVPAVQQLLVPARPRVPAAAPLALPRRQGGDVDGRAHPRNT